MARDRLSFFSGGCRERWKNFPTNVLEAGKTELAVLATGIEPEVLTPEQAEARAVTSGRIFERMWDYLTHGDPEN